MSYQRKTKDRWDIIQTGDMVGNVRTANIPEQMQREASESTERILQEELM